MASTHESMAQQARLPSLNTVMTTPYNNASAAHLVFGASSSSQFGNANGPQSSSASLLPFMNLEQQNAFQKQLQSQYEAAYKHHMAQPAGEYGHLLTRVTSASMQAPASSAASAASSPTARLAAASAGAPGAHQNTASSKDWAKQRAAKAQRSRQRNGQNTLATVFPEMAAEWHPTKNGDLRPEHVTPKAGRTVWWRCSKDATHSWQARIDNRTRRNQPCPFCGRRSRGGGVSRKSSARHTTNSAVSPPSSANNSDQEDEQSHDRALAPVASKRKARASKSKALRLSAELAENEDEDFGDLESAYLSNAKRSRRSGIVDEDDDEDDIVDEENASASASDSYVYDAAPSPEDTYATMTSFAALVAASEAIEGHAF